MTGKNDGKCEYIVEIKKYLNTFSYRTIVFQISYITIIIDINIVFCVFKIHQLLRALQYYKIKNVVYIFISKSNYY